MEKIKIVVDSACDIPDDQLKALDIDMVSVPMTIDGEGFYERESFSIDEYYEILKKAKEIPKTSRVPMDSFIESYDKAFIEGYDQVICITINALGSGTNTSAIMAREMFYEKSPEAKGKLEIHVVDSRTYSLGFGWPAMAAGEMALGSADSQSILTYLEDWFNSVEIYLSCYTLKYVQKSGRINFASAFVGEVLGMRPIINAVDGKSENIDRVRGDKNVPSALFDIYKKAGLPKENEVFIIHGENTENALEIQQMFKSELGLDVPMFKAGASIATNVGTRFLAIGFRGKPRHRS